MWGHIRRYRLLSAVAMHMHGHGAWAMWRSSRAQGRRGSGGRICLTLSLSLSLSLLQVTSRFEFPLVKKGENRGNARWFYNLTNDATLHVSVFNGKYIFRPFCENITHIVCPVSHWLGANRIMSSATIVVVSLKGCSYLKSTRVELLDQLYRVTFQVGP